MNEKYIPLYRKYRPKNISEVVGQEHVKKALTNAIELGKISHAYLFTGPRGTGKTSIARILAKSLNCQDGPTIKPCEKCPSCLDIKNSTPMDVIEIDAASNRKVEDTQNILEKIQYVPVNGKYKIYIIDEVHMLTNHAFNALLKTLEEPPENVVFILATTEPHKVLETITSRCQRFDFRRITTEDIVNHLKNIAKEEKIKIDDEALFTIAKNAAGGMRDSLALLDQASVLDSTKTITSEDINRLLGRLSFDMLYKMSNNIITSNPQSAIELLEEIYNSGNEPSQILVNLLGYLKNLLIVKNCSGDALLADLTQLNASQITELKKQAEEVETHQITFLIEKTVYYIKELKTTTNQHLWLEIAIIDLANLAQNTSLLQLQERVLKLEGSGGSQSNYSAPSSYVQKPSVASAEKPSVSTPINGPNPISSNKSEKTSKEISHEKPSDEKVKPEQKAETPQQPPKKVEEAEDISPMPISHPAQKDGIQELWLGLLQNISSTPTVSLLTQHTTPLEISEEKVVIGCKENFLKLVASDTKKSAIEEGAKKFFNKPVSVIIKTASAEELASSEKKNLIIEKPTPKPVAKPEKQENSLNEDDEFVEHELAKKHNNEEKKARVPMASDQVNMVMKLFDGKYID